MTDDYVPPTLLPELPAVYGTDKLRTALTNADKKIPTRWRTPGSGRHGIQNSLCNDELRHAYNRRKEHIEGAHRLRRWATGALGGGLPPRPGQKERAFAFWYDKSGADHAELPKVCSDGLASAAHKGDFEVHLLSYQLIRNVPAGVCRINCEEHMPKSRFLSLLAVGLPIPLCADYIRLKALSSYTGWLIDCDTLWLRPPTFDLDGPSYGHVFGSMEAGHCAFREGPSLAWRRWSLQYLRQPGDKLFIATPFRLPSSSPMLNDMVSWFANLFDQVVLTAPTPIAAPLEYNLGMKKYFELVQQWGLEDACRGPLEFSPVPRWWSRKRCFRSMAKDEQAILTSIREQSSTGVNAFWQTSIKGGRPVRDYEEMSADSLWNALLNQARDSGWGEKASY